MKLIFLLSLILGLPACSFEQEHVSTSEKPIAGTVVILDGTSSSGKTTMINEIKKVKGDKYEFVNLDSFQESYSPYEELLKKLENKDLNQKSKDELIENYMNQLINDFYTFSKNEALAGKTVIVDTVPIHENVEKEDKLVKEILKDVKNIRVLLYCPLKVLVERVEQRNLSGDHRYTLQAAAQFQQLYKAQDKDSEEVLDKTPTSEMKEIRKQAIKDFLNAAPPNTSQEEINKVTLEQKDLYKEYVKQFKLDELNEVPIVSKKPYNLILDCRHTPEELAQEVTKFIGETNQQLSDWQLSIEKALGSKKSDTFEAHDKSGNPVILEWKMTKTQEPGYAKIMNEVEDLFIQAFSPNAMRFIKNHPDIPFTVEKNHPYKQLESLFKNGIEKVDWKLVEEKMKSMAQSYWKEKTSENTCKKLTNSIFIFVLAKDKITKKLLGFSIYQIDDDDPAGTVILEPLAVDPKEQVRGLGKLLTSSIFTIVPNINRITLSVESENEPAIKAYQAWGFGEYHSNDEFHKNMEYLTKKSDILQKVARDLK